MKSFKSFLFVCLFFLSPFSVLAAPVNINSADEASLAENLNGVGPSIARAIVQYRKQHGPFKSVEDLAQVKGIGPRILDKNRGNILLKKPTQAARK
jgi:competence protein ComEA